jgi:sarcosine oxidase/L-pipecolate oxidase
VLICSQFFPILGRLVADRLEHKLDPGLAKKFAFDRVSDGNDLTRQLQATKELNISQLCSSADLLPIIPKAVS